MAQFLYDIRFKIFTNFDWRYLSNQLTKFDEFFFIRILQECIIRIKKFSLNLIDWLPRYLRLKFDKQFCHMFLKFSSNFDWRYLSNQSIKFDENFFILILYFCRIRIKKNSSNLIDWLSRYLWSKFGKQFWYSSCMTYILKFLQTLIKDISATNRSNLMNCFLFEFYRNV